MRRHLTISIIAFNVDEFRCIAQLSADEPTFRREKSFVNKLNVILVQVRACADQGLLRSLGLIRKTARI